MPQPARSTMRTSRSAKCQPRRSASRRPTVVLPLPMKPVSARMRKLRAGISTEAGSLHPPPDADCTTEGGQHQPRTAFVVDAEERTREGGQMMADVARLLELGFVFHLAPHGDGRDVEGIAGREAHLDLAAVVA